MSQSATTDAGTHASTAPDDVATQVAWLVDRARISDLLVEFARTLDQREWAAHIALYLPEGSFEVPGVVRLQGHEQLWATASPKGLAGYVGTWHLSSNHAITVEGDTARTRSYLIGVHLLAADDPTHHADGGGWYDCTLRRTPQGWRFETVRITETWRNATALPHIDTAPVGS